MQVAQSFGSRDAFFTYFFNNIRHFCYNMNIVRVPDDAVVKIAATSLQAYVWMAGWRDGGAGIIGFSLVMVWFPFLSPSFSLAGRSSPRLATLTPTSTFSILTRR